GRGGGWCGRATGDTAVNSAAPTERTARGAEVSWRVPPPNAAPRRASTAGAALGSACMPAVLRLAVLGPAVLGPAVLGPAVLGRVARATRLLRASWVAT